MVMEVIVGAIALGFIVLVVFLSMTLHEARLTLKKTDKTLTDVRKLIEKLSEPGLELITHVDKLTKDITKKSEALDVIFRPFYHKKKEKAEISKDGSAKVSEVVDFVADGVVLFNKIKDGIKEYVKSR